MITSASKAGSAKTIAIAEVMTGSLPEAARRSIGGVTPPPISSVGTYHHRMRQFFHLQVADIVQVPGLLKSPHGPRLGTGAGATTTLHANS